MKYTTKYKIKTALKRVQTNLSRFIEDNLDILAPVFVLLLVAIILTCLDIYQLETVVIQSNIVGLFFNILVFGILIVLINKRLEKKRNIKRYKEEIDDYRGWTEQEATFRIIGNIRRLNKSRISKIDLSNCYLRKALLSKANLQEAKLYSSNLRGANLEGANLEGADLSMTDLSNANLSSGNLCSAHGATVSYSGANFTHASLKNSMFFRCFFLNSELFLAELQGADFSECNLNGASLILAKMQGAKFSGTSFINANLDRANLQGAILRKVVETTPYGDMFSVNNLKGADLSEADLRNADLREVKDITIEQLSKVKTLYKTRLDPELEQQIKQKYPHLFEKPKE